MGLLPVGGTDPSTIVVRKTFTEVCEFLMQFNYQRACDGGDDPDLAGLVLLFLYLLFRVFKTFKSASYVPHLSEKVKNVLPQSLVILTAIT